MFSDTLDCFRPDAFGLLRKISLMIDDGMLEEIAAADYGHDIQVHHAKLLAIRDAMRFDVPMEWEPQEVLELIRWSEPDDPTWKPGGYGDRGHWMRAFCCSALLSAASLDENEDLRNGWNSTVIQLLDSLASIDARLYVPAASLLASLIAKFEFKEDVEDLAFFGVGLLWLALRLRPPISDTVVNSLIDWIRARELMQPHDIKKEKYSGRWLLGTTYFDLSHSGWERLISSLQTLDISDRSSTTQRQVKWIGSQL